MVRRRLPSLSGLRAFEAFARHGSMTAAAEELGVTHGAVSRQVRAIEAELSLSLVEGPRHRLVLTEAGQQIASATSTALDLIAAALPGGGPAEELVVSCYASFAMKWLIPRLPGFVEQHPGVRIRIVEERGAIDFSRGGVDAAIRLDDQPHPRGMRRLAFLGHWHGPVLSAALFERCGGDLDQVLALPRLHSETYPAAWANWSARAGLDLAEAPVERAFEHNTYMLEAAAAGLGVAIVPWAFAGADIASGRLAAPFGFVPLSARFTYFRPRLGDNPIASAFGDWLRREGASAPKPPNALVSPGRRVSNSQD
jgi:DNA-binding transcriptional LysR family regulator